MPDHSLISDRKQDHIRINLEEDVRSSITTGLEDYRFIHQALPEFDLEEINPLQTIFGKRVSSPMLISSMTGGTQEAERINRNLAEAAQEHRIAMGVGSQRPAIENPDLAYTFQVRRWCPDILLLANLGAIQLNYSYTLEHCQRAVDMIEADALILHLNGLQEALQPEGDTRFSGLLTKIEKICRAIQVPVIAKEVGWGISGKTAKQLQEAGVSAIDVAGAGGTSWSQVEMKRIKDPHLVKVAAAFRNWGIPTAESIKQVRAAVPGMMIFASGGLKDGIDAAKCIALGASLAGMAAVFLKAAAVSAEEVAESIEEIRRTLVITMFASGAASIEDLQHVELIQTTKR
jgi:isopentenyl-diphosphate delta-isomerase